MSGHNKVDSKTMAERVHEVSLLLRRKPLKYIIQYMIDKWKIERCQAYRYVKSARVDWENYFANLKSSGKGYYVTQLRDLKDEAYGRAVIVGKGDNKMVINVPDLGLVFDITKEEAKLMGIYPAEKHEVDVRKVIVIGKKKEKGEENENC